MTSISKKELATNSLQTSLSNSYSIQADVAIDICDGNLRPYSTTNQPYIEETMLVLLIVQEIWLFQSFCGSLTLEVAQLVPMRAHGLVYDAFLRMYQVSSCSGMTMIDVMGQTKQEHRSVIEGSFALGVKCHSFCFYLYVCLCFVYAYFIFV